MLVRVAPSSVHLAEVPRQSMKAALKRALKITTGWLLLIGGIAGLFLPFLQGILMIAGGLWILSSEYHWARRAHAWVQEKWVKVRGAGSAKTGS